MNDSLGYFPSGGNYPFGGVDFLDPSTMLDPSYSPELNNVDTILGSLQKRKGYAALGGAVTGVVLAIIEYKAIDGTVTLLCITTSDEYKWSGSAWTKITYKDSGGTEHQRTGSEDNGLDWVIATGTDSTGAIKKWVIITNGVDKPRYWDGTLATFYEYSTASVASHGAALVYSGLVTFKTVSTLNGYIVLGNTTTSAAEPNVVVWSDTGSLVDFTTNNSGANQLVDAVGVIVKILPLGDRLYIYAEDSIHEMVHIGGNDIFAIQKKLSNTRLLSGRAIVDVGPFHYFMSQENIYLFDGTTGIRRVGDRIVPRYRDRLQSDLKTRAFGFLDQPKNAIYFIVPTSSTTSLVFKVEFSIFDIEATRWVVHQYADRITAMGFFSSTSTPAWQDVGSSVKWSDMAGTWNQASVNKGFPRRVLGHSAKVSLCDETNLADASAAINASWESMDFTLPRTYVSQSARWVEVEFEARGTSVTISTSGDQGQNYVDRNTFNLTGSWKRYRSFFDTASETMRVKFGNAVSGSGFEIRYYRLWFIPDGV